jgi:predicted glycosyltransferase
VSLEETNRDRVIDANSALLWVDIENPPQVQYLLPVARAANSVGARVMVTARDYGETFALLEDRQQPYRRVGAAYGARKIQKARGVVRRVGSLVTAVRPERPSVLVCASRAAALAASLLRIPSIVILDYEFVDLTAFRLSGAKILFPDVIDPDLLRRRGIPARSLAPFKGLKEDLTFFDASLDSVKEVDFGTRGDDVRVLVRPAAEQSHYFRPESRAIVGLALQYLAERNAQVVFAARYPQQVRALEGIAWSRPPVVISKPVPFVSLLKAVDAVVCSGGTMFREAAYLGIPAYSIFQGPLGAVDRHLEAVGRACLIRSAEDLDKIRIERRSGSLSPMRINPGLADDIAASALAAGRNR